MFFGLLQYTLDGRKYLSKDSLYPNDPIEKDDLRPIIIWTLVGVAVLLVVLGLLAAMGQLNITNIINIITFIAIALPIYYFIMMLNSKKVTKPEKSRVIAYIPLFIAAAIFWAIEESGSS